MWCVTYEHRGSFTGTTCSYRNTLTLIDEWWAADTAVQCDKGSSTWQFHQQFLLKLFPSIKPLERGNPDIRAQILGPDLKATTFKCHQDHIASNNHRSHALDELSCGHTGCYWSHGELGCELLGAIAQAISRCCWHSQPFTISIGSMFFCFPKG